MKIGKIKLISIIITCIIFCGLFINYKINKFINRNVEYKELTNPPLISVIMPIYNRKEYLGKAVKSVLNQTYQNLEIILVDDHSTDGAYEMLQEYADKDKRIKLFRNEKNSFVSATRNVGLKNATGKYLYFIDSDDWIDENYLKEMVIEAEENNLDVVVNPNIYFFNSKKNKISNMIKYNIISQKQDKFYPRKSSLVWNKLYKRNIQLENNILFSEYLLLCEDNEFNTIFLSKSKNIKTIDANNFYYYRMKHGNSVFQSLDAIKKIDAINYMTKKLNKYLEDNNLLGTIGNISPPVNVDIYLKEVKDKKIRNEKYMETRNIYLNLKDNILNNKELYSNDEINKFNNMLKYDSYNKYIFNEYKNNLIFFVIVTINILFLSFCVKYIFVMVKNFVKYIKSKIK